MRLVNHRSIVVRLSLIEKLLIKLKMGAFGLGFFCLKHIECLLSLAGLHHDAGTVSGGHR